MTMTRTEIMKACLAEAGFPDAHVEGECLLCNCGWPSVHDIEGDEMWRAVHRAFVIMDCPNTLPCFDCWFSNEDIEDCPHEAYA